MMTEQEHNNVQWKKVRFGEFFDMLPTNTLSRDKLNNQQGEYQNIHYGDVLIKYPFCLDCNNAEVPYINDGVKFNTAEVRDGDVIFADTAEDDTVGKCVEVLNVGDRKIVSGLHTYFCRPRHKMALGYLGYYLNSNHFHNQLLPYIAGSKVSSVNRTSIARTFISYPADLSAQRRIAAILASADKVIAATQKTIAKYKQIKQGMMEELFNEQCTMNNVQWRKVRLGEVCEPSSEKYNPLTERDFSFCIEMENINQESGTINGKSDITKLLSLKNKFYKGEVLFGKLRPYLRKYWLADCDGACSTEIWVLKKAEDIDNQFLFYLFQSDFINRIANQSSGTKMPRADWNFMKKQELYIPYKNNKPDLTEQRRIASILSGIDAKIVAEEKALEKYGQVKKGLMERLLNE